MEFDPVRDLPDMRAFSSEGKSKDIRRTLDFVEGRMQVAEAMSSLASEEFLSNVDPVGCVVVLHCDHEKGDYLIGNVMPMRRGGWSLTLIMSGDVIGWLNHIEKNDMQIAPVMSEVDSYARFLLITGILPEEDYEDFTQAPGDTPEKARWIERRLHRLYKHEVKGEGDQFARIARVLDHIRHVVVASQWDPRKQPLAEMKQMILDRAAAALERSSDDAGAEEEADEGPRIRDAGELGTVDWWTGRSLGDLN